MKNFPFKLISTTAFSVTILTLVGYYLYLDYHWGRFFPGVEVAQFQAGGKTPSQLKNILAQNFDQHRSRPLTLTHDQQSFTLNLSISSPQLDINGALDQAYSVGRSANFMTNLQTQIKALRGGIKITPTLSFRKADQLKGQIDDINKLIKVWPIDSQISLGPPLSYTPSRGGIELDQAVFLKQLEDYLSFQQQAPQVLPTKSLLPKFDERSAKIALGVLERLEKQPLNLKYGQKVWIVDQKTFLTLLSTQGSPPNPPENNPTLLTPQPSQKPNFSILNQPKLLEFIQQISDEVDQEPQDARFSFDPKSPQRVKEFKPSQMGQKLDKDQVLALINQAFRESSPAADITLPVAIISPKITTSSVNNLGIKELIGQGISHFAGSIENRIYNIALAASRLNGVLVPPGETFSFNQTAGDISAETGYKPAYVIKSGRTVLDDGGGVCQVSTTVFRAALNAGLPILQRTAHAYRVAYYEQGFPPGLDATVFAPYVDLKFKNDTQSYILIQSYTQGTTLYVDLYGTGDGRVSTLTKPVVTGETPPPPELRQEDPTMPRGVVKQVDWAAWGAKVYFKRTVTRNKETLINETWNSHFRPWQAIFLVGTGG